MGVQRTAGFEGHPEDLGVIIAIHSTHADRFNARNSDLNAITFGRYRHTRFSAWSRAHVPSDVAVGELELPLVHKRRVCTLTSASGDSGERFSRCSCRQSRAVAKDTGRAINFEFCHAACDDRTGGLGGRYS